MHSTLFITFSTNLGNFKLTFPLKNNSLLRTQFTVLAVLFTYTVHDKIRGSRELVKIPGKERRLGGLDMQTHLIGSASRRWGATNFKGA